MHIYVTLNGDQKLLAKLHKHAQVPTPALDISAGEVPRERQAAQTLSLSSESSQEGMGPGPDSLFFSSKLSP